MIVLTNNSRLTLPKVNRCKLDPCNLYQLILQNNATKEITVFKLRDYSSGNPLYFVFRFAIPKWLEFAEYDIYLVANNRWQPTQINEDSVKSTVRLTDKTAVSVNGFGLLSNGRLLVTSRIKARLVDGTKQLQSSGCNIVVNAKSEDNRIEGEIQTEIDIIYTDLLKYKPKDESPFIEPTHSISKVKYKEHKRL